VLAKVILQGFIVVPDSDLDIVKSELIIHKMLTLKEAGCLTFTVTADAADPYKFSVYEEFVNQIAFDNHQARVKFSNWGEVTKNVERHYKISSGE
jgi:quinol monooxygenase YgiN